jgi:acetyl-CoA carboxylase biotin carboxyl carrier protein
VPTFPAAAINGPLLIGGSAFYKRPTLFQNVPETISPMDIKALKEITKLMRDNELTEVEVESADIKIKLKKGYGGQMVPAPHLMMAPQSAPAVSASSPVSATPAAPVVDEFAGCKSIISPIPGTVYLKPNPDAANFTSIGSQIDESKVVCLIEAMKVFNEIKPDAGVKGQVKKICVTDGQAVEYGTVLFLIG